VGSGRVLAAACFSLAALGVLSGCARDRCGGFGPFVPKTGPVTYSQPRAAVALADEDHVWARFAAECDNEIARELRRFGEDSLWERARAERDLVAYRFLLVPWIQKGGHLVARVERSAGRGPRLVLKSSSACGSGGEELMKSTAVDLTDRDWNRMIECVRVARFWTVPEIGGDALVTDGEMCAFEGVDNGVHRVVLRDNFCRKEQTPVAGCWDEIMRIVRERHR
jgi:hypothetical protein